MRRAFSVFVMALAIAGQSTPAAAQDVHFLGATSFNTNDAFIDGDDRWQTGGASWSVMVGPKGTVDLPETPFALWELRARTQAITPDNYAAPAPSDRRAAGVLTVTLHNHFRFDGVEVAVGGGVGATGPQTGMLDFQGLLHSLTPSSEPVMAAAVRSNQIADGYYATALGEASYRLRLADDLTLRPFIEGQTGVETFARVGFDLFAGAGFDRGALARDGVTGFPYQTLKHTAPRGMSFTFGADAAKVFSSALLPEPAYSLSPTRVRARAGLHYQAEKASVFTGVSWLGPEFTAQPTGQLVTGVQLRWQF